MKKTRRTLIANHLRYDKTKGQTTAYTRDTNTIQIIQRLQENEPRYLERDKQVKALEGRNKLMAEEIENLKRIVQEVVVRKQIS